jgi:hypothetical protein
MRRLLIALSLASLAYAMRAPGAAATSKNAAWCETFCQSIVVGCHVTNGTVRGGPGCEAMYRACLDSCRASLPEG